MNNKKLGNSWEREFCGILAAQGYWVHFIAPDARGAQPFDIIAVKNGKAFAFDCKTCVAKSFSIRRLEDNQVMAFEKWLSCGNGDPMIAVLHEGRTYLVPYTELKAKNSIKLEDLNGAD